MAGSSDEEPARFVLLCNYHKTKGNKTLWPKVHFLPDSRSSRSTQPTVAACILERECVWGGGLQQQNKSLDRVKSKA